MDAKSWTSRPTDRNRRPTEARRSGSSSMTKTVGFASGIAISQGKNERRNEPLFSIATSARVPARSLVPLCRREQRLYHTRGTTQNRGALVWWHFGAQRMEFETRHKLKFTGHWHRPGGTLSTSYDVPARTPAFCTHASRL